MKKKLLLALSLVLSLSLVACGGEKDKKEITEGEDNKIVVGVSPTPHGEILEGLKDEFKAKGLEVDIKTFDDYVQPNKALAEGELDLNYFQHKPYLENFAKEHNLAIESIGSVHIEPMAFYSKEYKSLDELPDGAEILIPNDVSNGARALLLLEDNGLIKLKDRGNLNSTEKDIAENPKNIKFTAVEAATIARAYEDVAGGVINSNYAIGVGLEPTKDSVVIEEKDSIYANIVAVKTEDKDKEKYKKFMEVVNSEVCKEVIKDKFGEAVFPAFD